MQRKPTFNIGSLKNTEKLTFHHITNIKKVISSPGDRAGQYTQLIKSKAGLDIKVTIRFLSTHHPQGATEQYCLVSFIGFGTSLYSVVNI